MSRLRIDPATLVMLDRLILLLLTAVLSAILTAAMVMQYAFGDVPCPLCLLQRVAMFGCCFGLLHQLRTHDSERGGGIALLFALLLLALALRLTLFGAPRILRQAEAPRACPGGAPSGALRRC